jgi:non-specific serine/threonine protein kinase
VVRGLLEHARLVTLTGAGGVGRTRLALAVAQELIAAYRDGVWLVELAALAEPGLVPQAVATVLGVREEPGQSLQATLADYLQEKRPLLVLDNCEHLVGACAQLASTLLRSCPHLHLLATSREGLDVAGEQRYRVPSLPVPDLAHLPLPERLAESEAVALFLARAQERRTDFVLSAQNARAVAQVCARLDGIPLAIELAAARVGSLAVEGIAARLGDRFRLLAGGTRDALPRQRTLRAALDWSYDLLGEAEQLLLDRLSVFAGGWTLAAAEAVCAGNGVEAWEVLDLLDRLVNKSLVQAAETGGEVRYGLLETVRQYGQERLMAARETETMRARHAEYYRDLAVRVEMFIGGPEELWTQNQLEVELDNLRATLDWALAQGSSALGASVATALGWFWDAHGYLSEGRRYLDMVLAAGSAVPRALRASALNYSGLLAGRQGEYARAGPLLSEAIALCRDLGDGPRLAYCLNSLGVVELLQGHWGAATAALAEGQELAHRASAPLFEVMALYNLGTVRLLQGDYHPATELLREAVAGARQLGGMRGIGIGLVTLGLAELFASGATAAQPLLEEGLTLSAVGGNKLFVMYAFLGLAGVAVATGSPARAARILSAADSLSSAMRTRIGPAVQALVGQIGAATRGQLGEEDYLKEWNEGLRLPLQQAIAYALGQDAFGGASWPQ